MRYQGRITRWNDERGFGYIAPNGGGDELFVHVRALRGWRGRPVGGEIVTYGKATDARGRPCAGEVRRVDLRPVRPRGRPAPPDRGRGWLLVGFAVALAAAMGMGRLPPGTVLVYGAMSGLTFVAYARDKSAARQGRWRTSEQTLHLLALAAGWPGALAAQWLLRHKSSKASFQGMFWITVAVNVAGLLWLASRSGAAFLASLAER